MRACRGSLGDRSRRCLLAGAIAALVVPGCSGEERGRASERPPAAELPAADSARAAAPTFYRKGRTLDLNGDGQSDSVHLEATGTRPDSLAIALTLVVDGAARHREEWGSSYELALVEASLRRGPRADTLMRAQLDSVLASVVVQPLDASGVRLMAEDSAILDRVEPRPTHRTSFAYGYETTVRLVWDAPRRRFVRLWSCC